MTSVRIDVHSLDQARILQATMLGDDLLIAFSNGISIVLDVLDIKHLALSSAKEVVTDGEFRP